MVRFEIENSPLHTIVYGGSGTGKNFVRQYLELYGDQTSTEGLSHNTYQESDYTKKEDIEQITPVASTKTQSKTQKHINPIKYKHKQIGEFLERIYDIWQESPLDEIQEEVARLETHQDKEQVQEQKQIIIVCKDERDGINPDTNKLYDGLNILYQNVKK